MEHSESLKALAGALALVQGEIENASKNATNPHYGNRYADLAEIINTVRPVLTKHGLSVVQLPGYADGVATVQTILMHNSGEWLSGVSGAPLSKQDPQGVGSATTYLRRYSLAALCAIAQEDDDGEAASQPTRKRQSEPEEDDKPFSLDELVPFGKHKGRTWKDMVENEASYVKWAVASMDRLSFDAKEALTAALAGDGNAKSYDVIKLQDLLYRCANANVVSIEQAAQIEKVIDEADSTRVAETMKRLELRLDRARIAGPKPEEQGSLV